LVSRVIHTSKLANAIAKIQFTGMLGVLHSVHGVMDTWVGGSQLLSVAFVQASFMALQGLQSNLQLFKEMVKKKRTHNKLADNHKLHLYIVITYNCYCTVVAR
jgi:hypothetical protein